MVMVTKKMITIEGSIGCEEMERGTERGDQEDDQ